MKHSSSQTAVCREASVTIVKLSVCEALLIVAVARVRTLQGLPETF